MIDAIRNHRSVRHFDSRPIPQHVINDLLCAAVRASNTGNMQIYSIVVTQDRELLNAMAPCHFNQPAATTAPALVTFCADVHRFSQWCVQRGAQPGYDNFMWFLNGSIDAMLASENFSLEAVAAGLGICYLGTTLYNADKIIELLKLPHGVMPIMTVAVGYPSAAEQEREPTPRLPLEAVVHYDTYHPYSAQDIDNLWSERENSDETAALLRDNDLPNLARIFTEKRYVKADSLHFGEQYLESMRKQNLF